MLDSTRIELVIHPGPHFMEFDAKRKAIIARPGFWGQSISYAFPPDLSICTLHHLDWMRVSFSQAPLQPPVIPPTLSWHFLPSFPIIEASGRVPDVNDLRPFDAPGYHIPRRLLSLSFLFTNTLFVLKPL
jgi:hypothetical protein